MKKCVIEALVTVDNRGQIVIPKEVRKIAGICGGDKLTVLTYSREGEPYYIFLVKPETVMDEYRNNLIES